MNIEGAQNRGRMFEVLDNDISFQRSFRNQHFSKNNIEDEKVQELPDQDQYDDFMQQQQETTTRQMNNCDKQDILTLLKEQTNSTIEQAGNYTQYSKTKGDSNNLIQFNLPQSSNNEHSPFSTISYIKKQMAWLNERVSIRLEESPLKLPKGRSSIKDQRDSTKMFRPPFSTPHRDSSEFKDVFSPNYQMNMDEILSSQRLHKQLNSNIKREAEQDNQVFVKNYLIILSFLKKFTINMLRRVAYKNPKYLNKTHLNLIGDISTENTNFMIRQKQIKKSLQMSNIPFENSSEDIQRRLSVSDSKQLKSVKKQKQSLKQALLEKKDEIQFLFIQFVKNAFQGKALRPDNTFIIFLNLILLVQLVSHIFIIPIKLCFFIQQSENSPFLSFYMVATICLIIEILIGFQTGFYQTGVLVLDRIQIAKSYIKFQFLVELCSLLLILISAVKQIGIIETIIVILRFNQIRIKIERIDEHFEISAKFPTVYELNKLIVYILIMAHIWGCGFHLVGEYSKMSGYFPVNQNWITQQKLDDEGWLVRYINSFYFTTITMITIGYGDILPINIFEKIYVCFMTFITCGLFAYCVNSIGTIFAEIKQKQQILRQKTYEISNYLKFKGTKKDTYIKIIKYIEYLHSESDLIIVKGQQILSECPKELRDEVQQEYYSKILLSSILKNYFSPTFLYAISLKMKEKVLGPGEVLLTRGSPLSNLYFIIKGDVEYFYQNKDYQRSLLKINNIKIIDFKLFASDQTANISIRCQTKTTVAYFSKSDFQEILQLYCVDFVIFLCLNSLATYVYVFILFFLKEKFSYLKDQFINNERNETMCKSCSQYRHDISSCPQLHFSLDKDQVIQRHCYSSEQQRAKKQRSTTYRGEKYNSLRNQLIVKNFLKIFRWQKVSETYNKYQFINVVSEVNVVEKDRQFFKRCPKIVGFQLPSIQLQEEDDDDSQNQQLYTQMNDIINQEDELLENNTSEDDEDEDESQSSRSFSNDSQTTSQRNERLQFQQNNNFPQDEIILDPQKSHNSKINQQSYLNNKVFTMIKEEQEMDDSPLFIENQVAEVNKFDQNIEQNGSFTLNNNNSTSQSQISAFYQKANNSILPILSNQNEKNQSHHNLTHSHKSKAISPSNHLRSLNPDSLEIQESELNRNSIGVASGITKNSFTSQGNTNAYMKTLNKMGSLNSQNQNNESFVSLPNSIQMKQNYDDNSSQRLNPSLGGDNKIKEYTQYDEQSVSQQNSQSKQMKQLQKNINMLNMVTQSAIMQMNNFISSGQNPNQQDNQRRKSFFINDIQKIISKGKVNNRPQGETQDPKTVTFEQSQMHHNNMNYNNTASDHIFGCLLFEFDKHKEYIIYYPKGNMSNVVKIFKKVQQKNANFVKCQQKKNFQKEFSATSLVSLQEMWKSPSKIKLNPFHLFSQTSSQQIKMKNNS